jgi:hypothetical protein
MKPVKVHRWTSPTVRTTYTFGDGEQIPLVIFADDTVERAISKIAVGITEYHAQRQEPTPSLATVPYVWTKRAVLRIDVPNRAGYPIQPWSAVELPVEVPSHATQYREGDLFARDEVHVVFASDLPEHMRAHPIYFPDAQVSWKPPSLDSLQKETALLLRIWREGEKRKVERVSVTKLRWIAHAKEVSLFDLYHKTSVQKDAPFFQLVEDTTKVLYKVYQQHTIPLALLESWTAFDRVPKVPTLVAYFPIRTHVGHYVRASLEAGGKLLLQYTVDSRLHIKEEYLKKHAEKVKRWFEQRLQQKLVLSVDMMSIRAEFVAPQSNVLALSKVLNKYSPVFHVGKLQDGVLEVAYKRSANFRSRLDIADYIRKGVELGVPIEETIENLIHLGMPRADAPFWLEQYRSSLEMEEAPKRRSIASTGCLLRIGRSSMGYRVFMDYAASSEETKRMAVWLFGCIQELASTTAQNGENVPSKTRKSSSSTPARSVSSSEESTNPLADDLGSDVSFGSLGGAVGKQHQRYFNQLLSTADPAIFVETPKYSSKCQANNFRQPIPLTLAEKQALDASGHSKALDNTVVYGSDAEHAHVYTCPRIWCPLSRIPMTPEELEKHQGMCPGNKGEKPMLLYADKYWGNKADTPHYMGFLKEKSPKGLCLPCCMKKSLKAEQQQQCEVPRASVKSASKMPLPPPAAAPEPKQKEDTYIMNADAPIPKDRFGVIPKELHDLLQKDLAFALCSKTLSTTPCYVRQGLGVQEDPFVSALVAALGMKDKKEFLRRLQQQMDPLQFLTMEGSHVFQAFQADSAIVPSKHKGLVMEWKRWVQKYPAYRELFDVHGSLSAERLSRELGVYQAYKNFVEHVASADPKNPQHFVQLLHSMGFLLIVWKRNSQNQAAVLCPAFSSVHELVNFLPASRKVIMLMEDHGYYEPVILKQRSKQGVALHSLADTEAAVQHWQQCPANSYGYKKEVDLFRGLQAWTRTILMDASAFEIDRVVLRPDGRIYGFLTRGNIFVQAPRQGISMAVLPYLVSLFEAKRVLYHEDMQGQTFQIRNVIAQDLLLFYAKLQRMGLGMNAGNRTNDPSSPIFEAAWTMGPVSPLIAPLLRVHAWDETDGFMETLAKKDRAWYQMQHGVGKILVQHFETLVQPLLSRSRADRIRVLMNTFPSLPRKQLQVILEEVPLEDGKDAVLRWIKQLHIEDRMRAYTTTDVLEDPARNQWVFSQAAVEHGLPWSRLQARQGPRVAEAHNPLETFVAYPVSPVAPATPSFLKEQGASWKALPSKFSQIRNYQWKSYQMLVREEYHPEWMQELCSWLATQLGMMVEWSEVVYARNATMAKLVQDKAWVLPILEDPSVLAAWADQSGLKLRNAEDAWTRVLSKMPPLQRRQEWLTAVSKSAHIKPNDLDVFVMSQLFQLNILVLSRGGYGGKATGDKRGDMEDLFHSSYLHLAGKAWETCPLIILHKDTSKTFAKYSVIVNGKKEFLQTSWDEDVQRLMKYHIEHRK